MKTRWACPVCGVVRMAPRRMRADDSRRYCFPCSETTGRLVRRAAPTLEKRREAKREKRREAEKAERSRARERVAAKAAAWPESLRADWEKMLALPTVREYGASASLQIQSARRSGSSGRAWPGRVLIRAGRDRYDAVAVLLHELAHVVAYRRESWSDPWHHDSRFASTYASIAAEWLGLERLPAYIPRLYRGMNEMSRAVARYMRSVAEGLDPEEQQRKHEEQVASWKREAEEERTVT